MYTHNLDPIIFSIGPLAVRWYSLAYILGFIIAILTLQYFAKKGEIKLSKEKIYDFIFWLIIGVVIGGRLGHVIFWNPLYFFSNPLEILMVWKGGMAFHGGLIGAIIVTYWFCRKHKISFLRLADILSVPFMFIWALGRVANFINGELWGKLTDVAWCVKFPNVEGCRHPYTLYAAIEQTIVGFILLFTYSQKKIRDKEGFLFFLFICLAGLGRFIVEFWSADTTTIWLFTVGQWLSLLMFVIGLVVLFTRYKKNPSHKD